MATEILTQEDLKQFRLQLLEDLKTQFTQSHQSPKQWLKSSDVKKNAWHLSWHVAEFEN